MAKGAPQHGPGGRERRRDLGLEAELEQGVGDARDVGRVGGQEQVDDVLAGQAGHCRAADVLGRGGWPAGGDERDQAPGDLGRVRVGLVDLDRRGPVAADRRREGSSHARVGSPRVHGNGDAVPTGALLRKHGPVAATAAFHSFGGGVVGCVQVALLWNMPSESQAVRGGLRRQPDRALRCQPL